MTASLSAKEKTELRRRKILELIKRTGERSVDVIASVLEADRQLQLAAVPVKKSLIAKDLSVIQGRLIEQGESFRDLRYGLVAMQHSRLEMIGGMLFSKITQTHDPQYYNLYLRVLQLMARLHGLDAPVQMEVEAIALNQLNQQAAEMVAQLEGKLEPGVYQQVVSALGGNAVEAHEQTVIDVAVTHQQQEGTAPYPVVGLNSDPPIEIEQL
jgi:hypothetical protein